jgi:rod shape determining protein RodA
VPIPNLIFLASPVVSLLLAWSTAAWSIWMVALFGMLMVWRPFIWESIAVYLTNSAMGVFAMVVWGRLNPYQQNRLLSFLDPGADEFRRSAGYQGFQSMVAIGSGGWFGNGFTQGPQKRTGYIPEHWTDFIFSVVGEELGFVGVMLALGLFATLLGVMIQVARRAADPFTSMAVFGLGAVIFTHVFENVGMTVSIMPITGIPLPFFSYGGSFTLSLALAMGLTLRAAGEGRAAGYVDY